MFQQNESKSIEFVSNSQNTFHKKVKSQDPLQNIYSNLPRTCKNKFHKNKIKLNWLNLFKKFYYGITEWENFSWRNVTNKLR